MPYTITDRSTATAFVWDVTDNDAETVETFVYGAAPVQGHKKESWTPESWKQNVYDGLVAILKSRDEVEAESDLQPLTGVVA